MANPLEEEITVMVNGAAIKVRGLSPGEIGIADPNKPPSPINCKGALGQMGAGWMGRPSCKQLIDGFYQPFHADLSVKNK